MPTLNVIELFILGLLSDNGRMWLTKLKDACVQAQYPSQPILTAIIRLKRLGLMERTDGNKGPMTFGLTGIGRVALYLAQTHRAIADAQAEVPGDNTSAHYFLTNASQFLAIAGANLGRVLDIPDVTITEGSQGHK